MDFCAPRADHRRMGDKSPKAKDKAKKQDTVDKNQKKAVAAAKAAPPAPGAGKKGR
jgi:hypothetical protein